MSDKIMLNFRCPSSVLEAIDDLGKERYPANTKHRCDRSKTLMEIVRAGIEALSDGSVVLPAAIEVRQQPDDVRQQLSDNLSERITEIIERKTEPLRAELEDLKTSQAGAIEQVKAELRVELGELAAWPIAPMTNRDRQKLKQTEEKLAEVTRDRDSLKQQVETLTADRQQVEAQLSDLQKRLDEVEQNSAPAIDLSDKAGEVMNFFRTLLPKDTKLPKNTMTKLREILEATED